jgi:antitoxin CcdA
MSGARRTTRCIDRWIPRDPLEAALECDIDSSASLAFRLRQHVRAEWLAQNAEGIEAYNRDVAQHGSFGDALRSF